MPCTVYKKHLLIFVGHMTPIGWSFKFGNTKSTRTAKQRMELAWLEVDPNQFVHHLCTIMDPKLLWSWGKKEGFRTSSPGENPHQILLFMSTISQGTDHESTFGVWSLLYQSCRHLELAWNPNMTRIYIHRVCNWGPQNGIIDLFLIPCLMPCLSLTF
jgi:hypothetical protein